VLGVRGVLFRWGEVFLPWLWDEECVEQSSEFMPEGEMFLFKGP